MKIVFMWSNCFELKIFSTIVILSMKKNLKFLWCAEMLPGGDADAKTIVQHDKRLQNVLELINLHIPKDLAS